MAHPLVQFQPRGRRDLVATVARLVEEQKAERVVVGMPFLGDGTEGEQARRTRTAIDALRAVLPVPVVEWDERFSTQEAEEAMRQAGVRPDQRKARLDKVAAALILKAYLEAGAPM